MGELALCAILSRAQVMAESESTQEGGDEAEATGHNQFPVAMPIHRQRPAFRRICLGRADGRVGLRGRFGVSRSFGFACEDRPFFHRQINHQDLAVAMRFNQIGTGGPDAVQGVPPFFVERRREAKAPT